MIRHNHSVGAFLFGIAFFAILFALYRYKRPAEILTVLDEKSIVNQVDVSTGIMYFKSEKDVLEQLEYDDFRITPTNSRDLGGLYSGIYRDTQFGLQRSNRSFRAGDLETLLDIDPQTWLLPSEFSLIKRIPALRSDETLVFNEFPQHGYEIVGPYLFKFIFSDPEDKAQITIAVQCEKFPAGDRPNRTSFGELDSHVLQYDLSIKYRPSLPIEGEGFVFYALFMKRQTGFLIEAHGLNQQEFVTMLLSMLS